MAIIKCDRPMARHKRMSQIVTGSWQCNHNCETCICALKKNADGTWEHIKRGGEKDDKLKAEG